MAERPDNRLPEPTMDPAGLYREEMITDRKVGMIRVLNPVKSDGAADPARPTVYVGEAQIYTNMGTLPLSFEIDAKSLQQAVSGYAAAAKVAVEEAVKEIQELRREAASSIVVPGAGGGLGPGGMPGGGLMGGGKLKLP